MDAEMLAMSLRPTLLLILLLLMSVPAMAKEQFVPYSQVRDQLAPSATVDDGSISDSELKRLMDSGEKVLVLDARSKKEFDREHIRGAALPMDDQFYKQQELFRQQIIKSMPDDKPYLEEKMGSIPKDARIVAYCNRNCGLSKHLKIKLDKLGFTQVRWLSGGIDVWREKGYPLEVSS